jgi:hypothetical protein
MVKYIEELNKSHNGKYISCVISNTFIKKGLIHYCKHQKEFFILQNAKDGSKPTFFNHFGKDFKFSWTVQKGTVKSLSFNGVSEILLLKDQLQLIHELW